MYRLHPSRRLRELFTAKPYQGAHPARARYVFVGLDANYTDNIECHPVFPDVVDYHTDGPRFWRERGVHHPFLLAGYGRGGGRRYHASFARIGFGPEHADDVSFVELLHVPTLTGGTLERRDFDPEHLVFLSRSLRDGTAAHVLIAPTVLGHMRNMRTFDWMEIPPLSQCTGPLFVVKTMGERKIHRMYHLSNYGAHQKRIDADVSAVSALLGAQRRS